MECISLRSLRLPSPAKCQYAPPDSCACRLSSVPAEYGWPDAHFMNTHSAQTNPLFTVGHSNLELAVFLAVLARHRVQTLCDLRSRPASFRFPHFNREPLESGLAPAGIRYEFLGETLGGRPSDPRVWRIWRIVCRRRQCFCPPQHRCQS